MYKYNKIIAGVLAVVLGIQPCRTTLYAAETQIRTETQTETQIETEIEEITETQTVYLTETEQEQETVTEIETQTEQEEQTVIEFETESSDITESEEETVTEFETETELEGTTEIEPVSETIYENETEIFEGEEGDGNGLFQAGDFSVLNQNYVEEIALFSDTEEEYSLDKAAEYIYKQLKTKSEKIYLRDYNIVSSPSGTAAKDNAMLLLYYSVINDHPDLYYVRSAYSKGTVTAEDGTKYINSIYPIYFEDYDDDAFHKEAQKALSVVHDEMSDMEKAIAVHEYLVLHCEYDKERLAAGTMPKESYAAYGVLVNHIAVCQGYALAYKYLMNELGIECYIVTSDEKNHAWNMVVIDGKKYQLDATWDDPTWDKYGLVRHEYMFISDEKLKQDNGHYPWYVTKGSGVIEMEAVDTTYDDFFWRDVNSPIVYEEGNSFYYINENRNIVKRNISNYSFSEEEIIKESIGKWISYAVPYSGLSLYQDRLYYNTDNSIISINPYDITDTRTEFELVDDSVYIYGSICEAGEITYVKRNSASASGRSVIYNITDSMSYELTFVDKFDTEFDSVTVKKGESVQPPQITPPEGYTFLKWDGNYTNITKDETVTAVYAPIDYDITYILDGGTNSSKNPLIYNIETQTFMIDEPTRAHSIFEGWYTDEDFTQKVEKIDKGNIGDITLYAKWHYITYTVTFLDANERVLSVQEVIEGNAANVPDIEVPAGYSFLEWDNDYNNIIKDISIKAVYEPVKYTIKYVMGNEEGVKNSLKNPSEYTIENDAIILGEPTHIYDYVEFAGWYTDSGFTNRVTAIDKGSIGNITLYAKWQNIVYTVTFLDTDGSILSKQEVIKGRSAVAPEVEAPIGYNFLKWDMPYNEIRENTTVTVVYEPVKYTINYVTGNETFVTNNPQNPSEYTIETDTITLYEPTHKEESVEFAGWYTDADFLNNITVIDKGSIGNITLYAKWNGMWVEGICDMQYTGNAITFDTVNVYNGIQRLAAGRDYTINYLNNIKAASKDGKKAPQIVINAKNNYIGKLTKTFNIVPVSIKDCDIEEMSVTYKKGKIRRQVPVIIWNNTRLVNNRDFIVTYIQDPVEPGLYNVLIQGKGNFTGETQTTLTILDNSDKIPMSSVKVSKKIPDMIYDGQSVIVTEDMITLKSGNKKLIPYTDYEFVSHEYTQAGIQYVTVCAKGDTYTGELTTSFNIKGTRASSFKVSDTVYTGNKVSPAITDKSGNTLYEGEDYIVNSLTSTESVGTAKINITGINAYYGTVTKSFKVTARPINSSDITVEFVNKENIQPYEKGGAKPKVIVRYSSKVLEEGTDYTLSYKNNKNPGDKATVCINGKGNFKQKQTLSFTVGMGDLQNITVKVADRIVSRKKGGYVSTPILIDTNGNKLKSGKDYDRNIVYKSNGIVLNKKYDILPSGAEVVVEITGKGFYEGTNTTAVYRILDKGKSISKASVKVKTKFSYTGKPVKITKDDLTVKLNGNFLDENSYEILEDSYVNNIKKGKAKVTIKGVEGYGGTKTISFNISAYGIK